MKPADKKGQDYTPAQKTDAPAVQHVKQSSGDKVFDDAIDRMLKKPIYVSPAK
jgi:hypothetical protein